MVCTRTTLTLHIAAVRLVGPGLADLINYCACRRSGTQFVVDGVIKQRASCCVGTVILIVDAYGNGVLELLAEFIVGGGDRAEGG